MDRDRERNAEDDEAAAPESGGWREKLKPAAHYALLAFAPVVSIVALIVALVASGNRSDQAQLVEVNARIDKLEASLQTSKAEVENLKFAMSREKSLRGEERKKDEGLDAKVIQNISRLQAKLKVTPTLEEQLQAEAKALVAASRVESAAPVAATASAPAAVDKAQAASAPAPASADKKPAAPVAAPQAEEKKKAPEAPAKKTEKKMSPQVKAIKDAIDQYNKQ